MIGFIKVVRRRKNSRFSMEKSNKTRKALFDKSISFKLL